MREAPKTPSNSATSCRKARFKRFRWSSITLVSCSASEAMPWFWTAIRLQDTLLSSSNVGWGRRFRRPPAAAGGSAPMASTIAFSFGSPGSSRTSSLPSAAHLDSQRTRNRSSR